MNDTSTSTGESRSTVAWNSRFVGSDQGRKPQYQTEFVVMSTFRSSWKVNDARQPS